jgi:hypothetical protein
MTSVDSSTLLDHLNQLIVLRDNIQCLKAQKAELMSQVNDITVKMMEAARQLKEGKKVLDHCLETGDDPVQVRLTLTEKELVKQDYVKQDYVKNDVESYSADPYYKDLYNRLVKNHHIFNRD